MLDASRPLLDQPRIELEAFVSEVRPGNERALRLS
jgi:hypothetical protein